MQRENDFGPIDDDFDWVGELLSGPTVEEVRKEHELPNLHAICEHSPMVAFPEFMAYARRAGGRAFRVALWRALEREHYLTNQRKLPNGILSYPLPSKHQRDAASAALSNATEGRMRPLIEALSHYAHGRGHVPLVLNRLTWMMDEVGTILAEFEGERGQGEVPKAWKDLHSKLVELSTSIGVLEPLIKSLERRVEVDEAAEKTGPLLAAQGATMERLPWTSSTAAFAYIFTTLSTAGYFPIPRKGGKRNEPNFTGLARVLLQAFDVKGEDGTSLSAEQLRVRLTDAAPRPLAETKRAKFQIPDANVLIVPKAEELE